MRELRLATATASWNATSALLNSSYPASIASDMSASVRSMADSSSSDRNRAASQARRPVEDHAERDQLGHRHVVELDEPDHFLGHAGRENGRISGPFGLPGRERTRPLLSSTRRASRTVGRRPELCHQLPLARQPLTGLQITSRDRLLDLFDDALVEPYRRDLPELCTVTHGFFPSSVVMSSSLPGGRTGACRPGGTASAGRFVRTMPPPSRRRDRRNGGPRSAPRWADGPP